ncbi:hypothetical protein ADK55_05040 [Streptomyces sp. WM4235]|uniref:hypothetical protein n=1 Tax=Streptomyces sp. WM4235 TaxID=1415551 RepID=UPI0006AF7AE8|nr:hypothetical protein [Streptomyces sp. WM4235]KOU66700.1 hypothetical protein ADK55_05040 [Streptomyces sp. WM4235]
MDALRIDTDGSVVALPWPEEYTERRGVVRTAVGGSADAAIYHRRAHLHVHGNGQAEDLPMNLSAWVLASHWRGVEIPYAFHGPVVVTGPQLDGLDESVARQVLAMCAAVADVRAEWVTRLPVGESQARAELLAAVRHAVTALA